MRNIFVNKLFKMIEETKHFYQSNKFQEMNKRPDNKVETIIGIAEPELVNILVIVSKEHVNDAEYIAQRYKSLTDRILSVNPNTKITQGLGVLTETSHNNFQIITGDNKTMFFICSMGIITYPNGAMCTYRNKYGDSDTQLV